MFSIVTFTHAIVDLVLPARDSEIELRGLSIEKLRAVARYDGALPYHDTAVKALVWELKYHARATARALAGEYMSELLRGVLEEELGVPLLIPVPMHPNRRRERGHNQCEVLCEAALSYLERSYDYAPHALVRTRNTRPQQGLSKQVRIHNVEGSMRARETERIRGRVCLVVDDVSTTGATLAEAARALRAAGARRVITLSLAHS